MAIDLISPVLFGILFIVGYIAYQKGKVTIAQNTIKQILESDKFVEKIVEVYNNKTKADFDNLKKEFETIKTTQATNLEETKLVTTIQKATLPYFQELASMTNKQIVALAQQLGIQVQQAQQQQYVEQQNQQEQQMQDEDRTLGQEPELDAEGNLVPQEQPTNEEDNDVEILEEEELAEMETLQAQPPKGIPKPQPRKPMTLPPPPRMIPTQPELDEDEIDPALIPKFKQQKRPIGRPRTGTMSSRI